MLMKNGRISRKNAYQAMEKASEVVTKQTQLDEMIERVSKEFKLERIPHVERNVLRLALFELISGLNPPKVSIAEGVRLGRKYATAEAAHFINAILDAIYKEMDGAPKE